MCRRQIQDPRFLQEKAGMKVHTSRAPPIMESDANDVKGIESWMRKAGLSISSVEEHDWPHRTCSSEASPSSLPVPESCCLRFDIRLGMDGCFCFGTRVTPGASPAPAATAAACCVGVAGALRRIFGSTRIMSTTSAW